MTHYDDVDALADLVVRSPRPLLIGLDVDGVLAPIVSHADDAGLLDGMGPTVAAVARCRGIQVAVISGRSVDDLGRFAFGDDITVVGSHGMESRDQPMRPLDTTEAVRLAELTELAEQAAEQAGDGAWVEAKPASVALHVREADQAAGPGAIEELYRRSAGVEGAIIKAGSAVLELFTRSADKGTAIAHLARRFAAATTVFVGDDVTDEDAFAVLADGDIAIKVGDAPTIAAHRLADPHAVLAWLRRVADSAAH